jgi:glyoxylase-like metal-dependent hydrolase (beta-lactamase superfamily II)
VSEVSRVVLTHMHFDHAGRLDLFPRATFHIQDAEMAYCTGRCMCHSVLRLPFDVDDVIAAVRRVHAGSMQFHDGTAEIAPGITLHLIGGHSGGLQVVRVPTERGWVVLASDATHLWANIRTGNPFPIMADLTRMLEGYRIIESLADGPDHIIPGHDPLVRTRFPSIPGQPDIVRLDLPPTS